MNLPYYPLLPSDEYMRFTFYSEGPRGRITKVITYTLSQIKPFVIYNLALRDVDGETMQLTDINVTDNGDRDQVLMTVAKSVEIFCAYHPKIFVVARGNSPARNRLYRMLISNYFNEICLRFGVYGIKGSDFEPFRKNTEYDGFMVTTY